LKLQTLNVKTKQRNGQTLLTADKFFQQLISDRNVKFFKNLSFVLQTQKPNNAMSNKQRNDQTSLPFDERALKTKQSNNQTKK
jgi:hypothetical protein